MNPDFYTTEYLSFTSLFHLYLRVIDNNLRQQQSNHNYSVANQPRQVWNIKAIDSVRRYLQGCMLPISFIEIQQTKTAHQSKSDHLVAEIENTNEYFDGDISITQNVLRLPLFLPSFLPFLAVMRIRNYCAFYFRASDDNKIYTSLQGSVIYKSRGHIWSSRN